MGTYRAMDGVSGRPGVGSSGTQPPANVVSASGAWLLGTTFTVTGGVKWLDSYYIYLPSNADLVTYTFALWNSYATSTQQLISGSTATLSSPVRSEWNQVPLATPIQLAPGEIYTAAVGFTATNGIPMTSGQFGSSMPYASGITNGPLTVWDSPAGGGTSPFPWATAYGLAGGVFSNSLGADPTAAMPNNVSGSDLFWVDVLVDDTAPISYSGTYRLHPNAKNLGSTSNTGADTANNFTLGVQALCTQMCTVNWVWFFSPSGLTQLPTSIGIYQSSGPTLVASNSSPSWSGVAGSGWVKAALPGVTLQPGTKYKFCVCNGAGSPAVWNYYITKYWNPGGGANGGFGGGGLVTGPLSYYDTSTADTPGQASYNGGATLTYPTTNAGPFDYGVDLEVTISPSGSGLMIATFP